MDGWYSDGWVTSSGDFLPNGSKIQSTPGYAEIYHNTTVNAHELQYTSTVTYKYNGSEIVSEDLETEFHYNDLVNLKDPTKITNPISISEDKEFEWWETDSGKLYKAGEPISWAGAKNGDDSITLNVKLKDKDKVNVYYNSLSIINEDNVVETHIDSNSILYGGSHQVKDLTSVITDTVDGFGFSGWWKIGSKPIFDEWQRYNLPNQYLFSNDFEPTFDDNHYNSKYGIVDKEYTIQNITSNTELYPVYKDFSPSGVKLVNSYRDYIDGDEYSSKDAREEYFSYLIGNISSFDISLISSRYVVAWKIQLPSGIRLNTSNIECKIYSSQPNQSDPIYDTFTANEIAINNNTENNISYCYILLTNSGEYDSKQSVDPAYTYTFKLYNIKDSLNKDVVLDDIVLTAPSIVRDINRKGNVVSFFGGAKETPEKSQSSSVPELWVNGNLVVTGEIFTEPDGNENNNYGLKQAITIVASAVKYIEDKMNENGWKQGYTDGLDDISSGKFKNNS